MDTKLKARADDLDCRALRGEPLPEGLTQPEQLYYLTMRLMYRQYKLGYIGRDQAVQEKKQAREQLDAAYSDYLLHLHHAKLHRAFEMEFHKDSTPCSKCAECGLYAVITGLMEGSNDRT